MGHHTRGLYVVVSTEFDNRGLRIYRKFIEALNKVGVKYLDFTRLYNTNDVRYRASEEDYHNWALAARVIVREIVKDLGVGNDGSQGFRNQAQQGASPYEGPHVVGASPQRTMTLASDHQSSSNTFR
jgi:hypothetical protein